MQASTGQLPLCPICCDLLGKYGGVTTLPCGHNGCLDCFAEVQYSNPLCPLCREPFHPQQRLACNNELRDLIHLATSVYMDDATKDEGWEAFPTAKLTTAHYAHEVKLEQRNQPLSNVLGYSSARSASRKSPTAAAGHSSSSNNILQAASQAGANYLDNQLACNSSGNTNVNSLQYHEQYHEHPGLPRSAPSGTQRDVLDMEPPQWLPDSYSTICGGCQLPFKAVLRLRHHCRLCGKLFCHGCSSKQLLMPPRFQSRDPQRACDMCANLLEPLQPFLVGATAASVQPPVHDALDAVSLRSWLNNPWSSNMADELYKAANILSCFNQTVRLGPERRVPASLLAGAKGLALLSVVRVGAGWSCTAGTGIVVSRQRDGSWSAPCAAACYGIGWGLQLGGELTDVLLVLRTEEAVRAFAAGQTLGLGGRAGIAVGPLGRAAEASVRVGGLSARGAVVGFSCSKGANIGVSLEGSVTCARDAVNRKFYGYAVSARQLLIDCMVPQPPAAAVLYDSLACLMERWENRGLLVHTKEACAAAATAKVVGQEPSAASAGGVSSSSKNMLDAPGKQQQAQMQQYSSSSNSQAVPPGHQRQHQEYREPDDDDLFAVADCMFDTAASAPPAPAGMLQGYSSSGGRANTTASYRHYPVLSSAAAPAAADDDVEFSLPSAPTTRVLPETTIAAQQAEDSDEEPQYVLEW